MTARFPTVRLEAALRQRKEFVRINDPQQYKRCRVQLRAKGVVLRDIVPGSQIKTKEQQVCRDGEFLVAEIDAKVGGYGIVPADLDGAIVSSHYFLFAINEDVLNRQYLDYWIRTRDFQDQVRAQGSTNYAAIRPRDVLSYKIPLPPLAVQQRLVENMACILPKIREARDLHDRAMEEANLLLSSALKLAFTDLATRLVPVHEIGSFAEILRGRGPMYGSNTGALVVNQKCVRWVGIDLQHAKEVDADWARTLPSHLLLRDGDIAVNSTGEGTIGRACVVNGNAIGRPFDSHVLVVRVEPDKALPAFVAYFLRSPQGQLAIEESKGAKTTKQTELGTSKLGKIRLPLPSLQDQARLVAYIEGIRTRVEQATRIQDQVRPEIDALPTTVLARAFKGEL